MRAKRQANSLHGIVEARAPQASSLHGIVGARAPKNRFCSRKIFGSSPVIYL